MNVNFIDHKHISGNDKVFKFDENKVIFRQPDKPKEAVRNVQLLG